MHVKHEPLQLIPPQFETPLPPLQPAVRMFFIVDLMLSGGDVGTTPPTFIIGLIVGGMT